MDIDLRRKFKKENYEIKTNTFKIFFERQVFREKIATKNVE